MARTSRASVLDEQTFAVRVRFIIPEGGLGCLDEMHRWLRRRVGADGYAIHSASLGYTLPQVSVIHANDVTILAECIRDFGLQLHSEPKRSPSSGRGDIIASSA